MKILYDKNSNDFVPNSVKPIEYMRCYSRRFNNHETKLSSCLSGVIE